MNDGKKYAEGTPSEIFALGDKLSRIRLRITVCNENDKACCKRRVLQLVGQHMTEEELVNDYGHQTSTSKLCLFNRNTI